MFPVVVLRRKGSGSGAAAGFSVVEVMIAAAIFLIICIGMLPLFTRSINSNLIGNDYMNATNHGRSGLETLLQLYFDSPTLLVDAGTEKEIKDYWTQGDLKKAGDEEWLTVLPTTGEQVLWNRTTTLRQYGINALADGNVKPEEALPAGTDPIFIHFKELRSQVESTRAGGPIGGGKRVTLRVFKSF